MINLNRLRNAAVLFLAIVVVALAAPRAWAQTNWARYYASWQRKPTSEIVDKIRETQEELREAYKEYVCEAREAQERLIEFYKEHPGRRPARPPSGPARAWRQYQLRLARLQLLLTILRQRQAGFVPGQGKQIAKPNAPPAMFQPKMPFPGMNQMNQQLKAFAQFPLPGILYLQFFDANRDGKISRKEAVGTLLAARFTALDSNRDGFQTPAEMSP